MENNKFISFITNILAKMGKTKVVLAYLALITILIAFPIANANIDLKNKSIEIAFGTMSVLLFLTIVILTIPVILYLFPSINKKKKNNIFLDLYIPYFEEIFLYLDIQNYADWTYSLAVSGNPTISVKRYNNLNELVNYIITRPLHGKYKDWNCLLINMQLVVADLITVLNIHLIKFGDEAYTIEKFYKRISFNENYDEDLKSYTEELLLISDLVLELTRLSNLILEKVRKKVPNFLIHEGILNIYDTGWTKIVYQDKEISNSPYPGLAEFIKIRSTRGQFYSDEVNITYK